MSQLTLNRLHCDEIPLYDSEDDMRNKSMKKSFTTISYEYELFWMETLWIKALYPIQWNVMLQAKFIWGCYLTTATAQFNFNAFISVASWIFI